MSTAEQSPGILTESMDGPDIDVTIITILCIASYSRDSIDGNPVYVVIF